MTPEIPIKPFSPAPRPNAYICRCCDRPIKAHYYQIGEKIYCPSCYRGLPQNYDKPQWTMP